MLQSEWRIHLLGNFGARLGPRALDRLSTRQTELLLAILADQVGRPLGRETLITNLWPDSDSVACRNRLRVALVYLRRAMEPADTPGAVIRSHGLEIELSADCCSVDAEEFRSLCDAADHAVTREERIQKYSAADELYRGPFLEGWRGDWVEERRLYYSRMQASGQRAVSGLLEEAGDLEGSLRHIQRAIEAEPLRESFRRRELRLLAEIGDLGAAREAYDVYRKVLDREVGLAPSAPLQSWVRQLPRVKRSQRDLGAAAEPVAEPDATPASPTRVHLPVESSSFVGRKEEIADISELLLICRLVSLVGPGGIGKTRLAVRAAAANEDHFGSGIIFVPASSETVPASLIGTLLRQLGLNSEGDSLAKLKSYLLGNQSREGRNACLIVIDGLRNSGGTGEFLWRLLADIPSVTILTTSRSRLELPGEQVYQVRPLPLPDKDKPLDISLANPCVQLFVERAKQVNPRFAASRANATELVELCKELDGIPLAIELAAARSRGIPNSRLVLNLGLNAMLSEPKEKRARRISVLQSSLIGSLNSLSREDQRAFLFLCSFKGRFDVSAAGYVAGASQEMLRRLVEHSLLNVNIEKGQSRYSVLEIVREFGSRQSDPELREEASARHAVYYRDLLADVELLIFKGALRQSFRFFADPRDLMSALNRTIEVEDGETLSRMVYRLAWIWAFRGGLREGREAIDRLRRKRSLDEESAARLDMAEGLLACFQDRSEEAAEKLRACLPVLEKAKETTIVLHAQSTLALCAYIAGDFEECARILGEVQPQFRANSFVRSDATACQLLGSSLAEMGDIKSAKRWLAEAASLFSKSEEGHLAGYVDLAFARCASYLGRYEEARDYYSRALQEFTVWSDSRGIAYAIEGLGRISVFAGRLSAGACLLGAAQRMRKDLDIHRDYADSRDFKKATEILAKGLAGWVSDFDKGGTLTRPELDELAEGPFESLMVG